MIACSSWFPWSRERRCRILKTPVRVSDRQERVPGWKQDHLARATAVLLGVGGLGGEFALGVVRKGIGTLHIVDPGIVDPPDLGRQIFEARSLYKRKAVEARRILSRRGFLGTRLIPHACTFQELDLRRLSPSVVVCCVDAMVPGTRLAVCRICHKLGIPVVFCTVSTDADHGRVFIQERGGTCWACAFDGTEPASPGCPGVPAAIDILKTIAGIGLYAVDTLLMERKRDWNYRAVSLSRSDFGAGLLIPPRRACPVCAGGTPR